MSFHSKGDFEMDVPELAAANRAAAAAMPQNRVFLATVPPHQAGAMLIFCPHFAAMALADSYMAAVRSYLLPLRGGIS